MKVIEDIGTDSSRLVDARRPITIRDLFRHTAGFAYTYRARASNDTIDNLYLSNKLYENAQTGDDFLNKIGSIPLKYHPGSKWRYSYANDVLGFLIEKLSGENLHDYLTTAIFKPLKMKSTGFYVSKKNAERLCGNYEYADGSLKLIDDPATSSYLSAPTVFSGGGGLQDNVGGIVTSTQDFANFCNMLLHYGEYNGRQVLRPQTVELMISNQIANIHDRGFSVPGYGLGLGVSHEENEGRVKSINWAGGPYNTFFKIDYEHQVIAILMTQNSPWMHLGLMGKFGQIVSEESR